MNDIFDQYVYKWAKDRHFRYVYCNENYARAAGSDSPAAMLGKSDDDMPWRSLADLFRTGDGEIMSGTGLDRVNVPEKEIMVDRVADILVTETQLRDRFDKCIGVTGYFIDITGRTLIRKNGIFTDGREKFHLGSEFGNEYLTRAEFRVFTLLVQGLTVPEIAGRICRSKRTVETHVSRIVNKLQCGSKSQIPGAAIKGGFLWTLGDCLISGDEPDCDD